MGTENWTLKMSSDIKKANYSLVRKVKEQLKRQNKTRLLLQQNHEAEV